MKIVLIGVLLLLIGILLVLFSIPNYIKEIENIVYVVTMPPPTMREQFIAGNIDGFIAWEPFNADLVLNENASYLIQSSDIWPNHTCCVLTTKTEDENIIKALLWAHIKATEFINDPINYKKVVKYATEFTGKDEDVVREALDHIEFIEYPNEERFKEFFYKLKEYNYLIKPKEITFLDKSYYNEIKDKTEKPNFVNKTVRLGYLTGDLHQLAFYVALKEGYYDVVFKEVKTLKFNNGVYAMDAYHSNLIDAGYIGSSPVILKIVNEDIDIKVMGGANNVGSALVVRKDIKSLDDLEGKIIAIPGFGTVQDIIFKIIANSSNLKVVVKK